MIERTDEQRWDDAESIVDGNPSEFAVQELRRRQRRLRVAIWASVGFVTLVVVGTVILVVLVGHNGHHAAARSKVPVWQEIAGLAVQGVGLVVLAVGLVGYFRSGFWRQVWRSPALVLTLAQRRELSKQLRGRAPVDRDHVRVARHVGGLAVDPRLRRYFALLLPGVVLQTIGRLIAQPSSGLLIINGVTLIVYVGLAVFWVGRQRQVRTFLERTRAHA